jgi:hypothetical protein
MAAAVSSSSSPPSSSSSARPVVLLWRAVLSFVSPLMTNYLHGLVVAGGGASSGRVDGVDDGRNGGGESGGADVVVVVGARASPNDVALRRLAECCSTAIVAASWICDPSFADVASAPHPPARGGSGDADDDDDEGGDGRTIDSDDGDVPRLLSMAHSCLLACRRERIAEEGKENEGGKRALYTMKIKNEASPPALSSREKYTDSKKRELANFHCALAASTCRMELVDAVNIGGGGDPPSSSSSSSSSSENRVMDALIVAARKATIAAAVTKSSNALKSSTSSFSSATSPDPLYNANAKFGASYLQFLSAWLGMYHQPWPFCTVDRARIILRNAREAVSAARKLWARRGSFVEEMMLDVGEADLEGCLMGGLASLSEKLYRQSLHTLDKNVGDSKAIVGRNLVFMRTLHVHCLLGLARLLISRNDPGNAVAAEELSRDALDILLSLDCNHHDEQSQTSVLIDISRAYHICVSRQLIADACIRSFRPEDAGSFLAEAVRGKFFRCQCMINAIET